MSQSIVHIVGTGTIGEPLIGLFSNLKEALGIDEVTFHKRTPLSYERPKVNSLMRRGARLAVDEERRKDFERLGHVVSFTHREALERATVVIDCTPVGNRHKSRYVDLMGPKAFLVQGGDVAFGQPYAYGINDETLDTDDRFVQIVSCNTHNICALIKTLAQDEPGRYCLRRGQFVCMRRATDMSQNEGFIAAPEVGNHQDVRFGTHHARDAWHVFQTLNQDFDLVSSEMCIPTQYMHTLHFTLELDRPTTRDRCIASLRQNPRVALTERRSAALVFSFGRDHGHYGRLIDEAVVPHETLHVSPDGHRVLGFCFTPQDGGSLFSSVACTLRYLHGEDPWQRLQALRPWMFQEI